MELFYRKEGQGQDIVILHGLFGSSDNWMSISKKLAENYTVWLLDQRNHGQSPHDNDFTYDAMAEDLDEFLKQHNISNPILLGHSMGGKVAMNYALKHQPELEKLVIADIAPKYYPPHHQQILAGLNSIDIQNVKSRGEIDKQLSEYIREMGVRAFLMKNIYRTEDGNYDWRINLPVITNQIENVGDENLGDYSYAGETLFIRGERSDYILDEDLDLIQKFFPNSHLDTVINAGHWLHAEQPVDFLNKILNFFQS